MKPIEDSDAHRRSEASRWFVVLQKPELSTRVLQAWKKWESVPENRRVFDEIERLWARTGDAAHPKIPHAKALLGDRYDGVYSVAAWKNTRREFSYRRSVALAAVLTLLVVGALAVTRNAGWTDNNDRTTTFETAIAEKREAILDDGSTVLLGAKTSIAAHMTADRRTVVLERGEALFDVARDARRPFTVRAGGHAITAIGTAFNVRRRGDDQVIVTVTDGAVQIVQDAAEGLPAGMALVKRLERGQQVTYGRQGFVSDPQSVDERSAVAWSEGRLLYRSEPLRDVLTDVNRYSRRSVVLGDSAAGDLLYSGTVFERNVDEWVANLVKVYPGLEVILTNMNTVTIQSRPPIHSP